MSIKLKLVVLFLILTLLPMGIIAVYSTSTSSDALRESAKLFLKAKLDSFAQIVEHEVGGRSLTGFIKQIIINALVEKAKEEKYFTSGFLSIVKMDGTVVYHPDEELINKNLLDRNYVAKALEQKKGYYSYEVNGKGYESYLAYNKDLDIILWAIVPRTEVFEAATRMQRNNFVFISVVAIFIAIIGLFFASSISNPIKNVVRDITYIAENLDFTSISIEKYANRHDEIGILVKSFLKLVDRWIGVIEKVTQVSKSLLESSAQLAETSEDSSAASEEIAASIEEVSNRANDQTNYLNQAIEAVNQLVKNLNNTSSLGNAAFRLASTTLETAAQGEKSITNVVTQMNNINSVIGQISEVVNTLVQKSTQIDEIVNLIDSIANQTQLLALNAAIEAARAGEAGRGFSVVADEIKQLAEESMKSANQIKNLIEEIQEESRRASLAMDRGKKEVESGVKVVDEAGKLFSQITTVSQSNLKGSEQANEALQEAVKIADQIIDRVHEVAGIAEETAASAEEVSASTEEQTATMEQVSASATMLKEMAMELEKVISIFKLKNT
ncbi:hypothetical protein BBF96_09555 [Anoxybacter fermentans]|uniref:Methyl-accepting transducer domain-containing protein n=1 Tax=Anoxybacter fermentans TaxID=1323375 RepID=A0A3S9SZL4_9FIRM|nr:methyl-accepting chemotaxis protein [Anoxybacter fermentans]AZR73612.1 hypothetical protein BBF96_09555 [Anoxybacter fermentans]